MASSGFKGSCKGFLGGLNYSLYRIWLGSVKGSFLYKLG